MDSILDKIDLYLTEDFLFESIKSDIDKLKPDEIRRDKSNIKLIWRKALDPKKWKKKIEKAIAAHMDKIKWLDVSKEGGNTIAELELGIKAQPKVQFNY